VIIKPTTRIKKKILDTRQPALATPRKPKIPAIIDNTKKTTASVISIANIDIFA
jgi:hypothetical protein